MSTKKLQIVTPIVTSVNGQTGDVTLDISGGGGSSDVFIIDATFDENNNATLSKTFIEIKQAILDKKIIAVVETSYNLVSTVTESIKATDDSFIILMLTTGLATYSQLMINPDNTAIIYTRSYPDWRSDDPDLSNSGAAYWNSTNKEWEIKDITSTAYKAGNGISISNDGTISVTAAKIYSGTSDTPSADLGENGDIYIQTEG